MIKEILFADTHNYHGKVDHRFIDLATQFSRLQDARSHQGGAALVVYFQGQKVVDIFTGKKSQDQDWQADHRQPLHPSLQQIYLDHRQQDDHY